MRNDERMTKAEIRRITRSITRVAWPFVIRTSFIIRHSDFVISTPFLIRHSDFVICTSSFGLPSSFGFRHSSFVICLAPHLRLSELLEQQFFQRRVGRGHEKVNAARRAILAEPLAKILHRLFVGVEAIFAEGDFLLRAGLGIYQA